MRGTSICRIGAAVFLLLVLALSPCQPYEAFGQEVDEADAPPQFSGAADTAPDQLPASTESPVAAETDAGMFLEKATGANIKSIVFSPVAPLAKTPITVQVSFDREFSLPVQLSYRWKINGQVVQESASSTMNLPTKRGDVVEVTVFTEEIRRENRAVSASVTVGGSPPTIRKTEESMDEKGRYEVHYEVEHPDGDPVTVSLNKGPKGMTLDTAKKELEWQVPPDTQGSFPVELVAADPSGAKVLCSFSITIRQEQQKPASEKNASSKSK